MNNNRLGLMTGSIALAMLGSAAITLVIDTQKDGIKKISIRPQLKK